jgi:hypothetical protein
MQTRQSVQTMKERQDYAELLKGIPVFSSCTPSVLREFAAYGVDTVHCAAGQTLSHQAPDHNLYLLASGSAILHAGDDVIVDVEPGDYFGTNPTHYHWLNVHVVAVTDLEVLVISPQEVSWLRQASSRDRHPSGIEWRIGLPTTTRRTSRRSRRRAILINQSA